jgi:hypothetical protein
MVRAQLVKRIAALLLVGSFFLPLSQCSLPATDAETGTKTAPGLVIDISAFSAYKWPSVESTLVALLFGWAALIQLLSPGSPGFDASRGIFAVEVTLSLLTIGGVSWLVYSWGQTIRYGAVVAYAATIAYLFAAIASHYANRHPNSTVETDARKSGARGSP